MIFRQEFHYIIVGYCNNRPGNRFVRRGDYEMIGPDNQVVQRSVFANKVKPDMVFEMSIVLRQDGVLETEGHICPSCDGTNIQSLTSAIDTWITWKVTSSISLVFQLTRTLQWTLRCNLSSKN